MGLFQNSEVAMRMRRMRFIIQVGIVVAIAGGVVQGVGAMERRSTPIEPVKISPLSEKTKEKVYLVVGEQASIGIFDEEALKEIHRED